MTAQEAIAKAQRVCYEHGEIRRELRIGKLTLAQALAATSADSMRVLDVLTCVWSIGARRAHRALGRVGVDVMRRHELRVRDLTLVQKLSLIADYGERAR